jgi:hypothetical protein
LLSPVSAVTFVARVKKETTEKLAVALYIIDY